MLKLNKTLAKNFLSLNYYYTHCSFIQNVQTQDLSWMCEESISLSPVISWQCNQATEYHKYVEALSMWRNAHKIKMYIGLLLLCCIYGQNVWIGAVVSKPLKELKSRCAHTLELVNWSILWTKPHNYSDGGKTKAFSALRSFFEGFRSLPLHIWIHPTTSCKCAKLDNFLRSTGNH